MLIDSCCIDIWRYVRHTRVEGRLGALIDLAGTSIQTIRAPG